MMSKLVNETRDPIHVTGVVLLERAASYARLASVANRLARWRIGPYARGE